MKPFTSSTSSQVTISVVEDPSTVSTSKTEKTASVDYDNAADDYDLNVEYRDWFDDDTIKYFLKNNHLMPILTIYTITHSLYKEYKNHKVILLLL